MPRRMLKDWTASEKMDQLTPQAEVFFTRLIMKADDFGVFPNNDRLLRSALFPLKNYGIIEVGAWKNECMFNDLICIFNADGKEYVAIKNFDQKLRRMHHTYPPPPVGQVPDNERTSVGQVSDKRPPEVRREVRREVEEKEKTRAWFDSCLDDIFRETLAVTHKGKNVNQAISEAWVFLSADKSRLRAADSSDVKKLVNTWLGNMKGEKQEQKRVKLL